MGFMNRVLLVAASLGVAVLFQNYRLLTRSLPAPDMNLNEYWGPGDGKDYKENTAVKPFDISPKPELIEDLHVQLGRPLKLHEPLEGVAFEYGFNSKHLQKVVTYWRETYLKKWSERIAFLKQFPHYTTEIQGLQMHFIHVKPKNTAGKKVLPLLLLHGWPGSVREFYDIIPMLTTPNDKSDYIFEVVAPSLPGYGWSQSSSKIGFASAQGAVVMRNLMQRLGYKKFLVQGGDWGAKFGADLTSLFPDNVLGYHSNMCGILTPAAFAKMFISKWWPSFFFEKHQMPFFMPEHDVAMELLQEMGYIHLQATKPDTIGTALSHNPVGLAAYILEKFSTWTNREYKKLTDGGLTQRFTLDALLDNIMIYYMTNSITTSQRLYAEMFASSNWVVNIDRVAVNVPTGCTRFINELSHNTDWQLSEKYSNIVHSTYHMDGGHFPAMELPEVLYSDIVEFVKKAFKGKDVNKEEL